MVPGSVPYEQASQEAPRIEGSESKALVCAVAAGSASPLRPTKPGGSGLLCWTAPLREEVLLSPPSTPVSLLRYSTYDGLEEEGHLHPLLRDIGAAKHLQAGLPVIPATVPEHGSHPLPPGPVRRQGEPLPATQACLEVAEQPADLANLKVGMLHALVDPKQGVQRWWWFVAANKLQSSCRTVVSPNLTIYLGPACPRASFKLMLQAAVSSDRKGGASFSKAAGRGYVELKCEEQLEGGACSALQLQVSIGHAGLAHSSWKRGRSMVHDFSQHNICALVSEQKPLCFQSVVDWGAEGFLVHVEAALVT